jgi:hypothetical protein
VQEEQEEETVDHANQEQNDLSNALENMRIMSV